MTHPVQHAIDAIMAGTVVATIIQVLPAIAALMSVIWYGVRIYYFIKEKRHGDVRHDHLDS